MKKTLFNLTRSSYLKSITTLLSGGVIAQAVAALSALWLPLFYGPETIGELSVVLSGVAFGSILFTMRYELTIVLPAEEAAARHLTLLPILIAGGLGTAGFLLAFIFWQLELPFYLLFVFIVAGSLFETFIQILQYALIRQRRFSVISTLKVVRSLGVGLLPILFFYLIREQGLIAGYLAGLFIAALLFSRNLRTLLPPSFNWSICRQQAKRYWPVVKFSFPSGLLNALSSHAQPIFIAALFSTTEAGYFFLAYRLLGLPAGLVASAVSQVYYASVVEKLAGDKRDAYHFTLKTAGGTAAVIAGGLILAAFAGPWVITTLLGAEWSRAGTILIWLIPLFAGKSILGSVSTLAEALNRTDLELAFNVAAVLILLGTLFWGYQSGDIQFFIIPYAILTSVAYFVLLFVFLKKLQVAGKA